MLEDRKAILLKVKNCLFLFIVATIIITIKTTTIEVTIVDKIILLVLTINI
jgi:hypothetical protein